MAEQDNAQQKSGQQDVMNALAAVAQAVLGQELRMVRESIRSLEQSLTQRIEGAMKETASSLDAAKRDMNARVDQLQQELSRASKAQADSLGSAQTKLEKSIGEVDQRLQKTAEASTRDLTSTRDMLRKEITDLRQKTDSDFAGVAQRLSGHEHELMVQQKEGKRIASVLASFARAFTGSEPEPEPAQQQQRPAQKDGAQQPAQKQGSGAPQQQNQGKQGVKIDSVDPENLPNSGDISDNIDKMFNLGGK
jgi:DNA anti-recombination protein RmuC